MHTQRANSSSQCAYHAHDSFVREMHKRFVDSEWFKARKKERRVTDTQLAEALGVERSVANKVVNGSVAFNAKRADAVARLLDQPVDQILFRAGITSAAFADRPVATGSDEVVVIQKLDLSLSMGPGTLIDDWVEAEPVSFDLAFLRAITRAPSERLKLVTGIGDSMYPTLAYGDAIMIDTTDRALARQDGIYWINLYGAAGIKRLRTIGQGRVLVKSDNPAVDDQEVSAEDLRIEGRAVWVARGL